MALYGSARDISLFRHLNREVMHKIIDINVDWYRLVLGDTITDIYGESTSRQYMQPQRIHCVVTRNDQEYNSEPQGVDVDQTMIFGFLRDDLIAVDAVINTGDIIEWNNKYWELDSQVDNQLIVGKDPATVKSIVDEFGSNWSILFQGHHTRVTKLDLINHRTNQNGI